MILRSPGSKGRDRAVVVRAGANRRSLIHTCAADRIGPNQVAGWNLKQVDFATKPAVQVIGAERAYRRTVMRDGNSSAKPETRSGEMDYPVIGCAVVCIHVEIEPAHCEYAAVA